MFTITRMQQTMFKYIVLQLFCGYNTQYSTAIPRLTSEPDNEFFGYRIFFRFFWIRLTNVLVDARDKIKQQT